MNGFHKALILQNYIFCMNWPNRHASYLAIIKVFGDCRNWIVLELDMECDSLLLEVCLFAFLAGFDVSASVVEYEH